MQEEYLNNKLDSKAKNILANKSLLSFLLKQEVPEYKDLDVKEIEKLIDINDGEYLLGIDNEDDYSGSRRIRYDLLITPRLPNSDEKIGMYIDVEMQNTSDDKDLLSRALYYSSSLICRQPKEIKNFNYQKLKKVYSLWICTNPRTDRLNTIIDYSLKAKQTYGNKIEDIQESNLMHIKFINLSNDTPNNETLDILRLIFMRTGLTSKEVSSTLQDNYDIIMTEKEVSDMPGWGKFMYNTGFEEGQADGRKQTLVSNILKFINHGMSTQEVFDTLEVPDDIKKEVLEKLNEEK